jgi:hypothetical protein
LGAVLAVHGEVVNMPDYQFDRDAPALGIFAIGLGIVVAILVGKATKAAAGRGARGRLLVCLVAGGVIVPLCFLLVLSLVYTLLGGGWGLWAISIFWTYWLRAWIVGGVIGMTVAVFWPGKKHEAPGTAQ